MPQLRRHQGLKFTLVGVLGLALLVAMGVALSIGSAQLGFSQVVTIVLQRFPLIGSRLSSEVSRAAQLIVFNIRLPRIILSVLVGGALSAAGVVFQGLFHNPMAEPYVIGVSSGAALGATLAFVLKLQLSFLGLGAVPIMAFVGGILTTLTVCQLGRVGHKVPMTVILLAGIAVGSFMSAINSILMVFNRDDTQQIIFWLMGGFSGRGWQHVHAVFPYIVVGLGIMFIYLQDLNVIALGEEKAQQLGMNILRVQLILIAAAALVTAAAVSVSGVIGFVGLIIPHLVRMVIGPDHRFLLPTATLVGGLYLLIADTLARTLFSPMELPVGVLTALAGAPFFLYLLRQNKHGLG